MYTRAASAIALVACLVLSPMAMAAKNTTTKPAAVKKDFSTQSKHSSTAWQARDWKTGAAPTVRAIPYQGPATRPAAYRAATTRPAGDYKFITNAKYDYFTDHYGASTGTSTAKSDVVGYVAPEKSSSNAGNPFVYRRTK